MRCSGCGGERLIKRGCKQGFQRYQCRACLRHSTDKAPRFSAETKAMALEMYMNSMGIRAIGRVLKASPASVLNWIRKDHALLQTRLAQARLAQPQPCPSGADIIEMDEIYTCVQKKRSAPWSGPPTAAPSAE